MKLRKCSFFQPKVYYLGHIITPGKLSVAVDNSKAFAKAIFLQNITQPRSFLGAANVYRRFVQKYSDIARPLNSMFRKDAEPDWENPTNEQRKAFETLKARLIPPPILALPKASRPYMIDTDASAYQLGATLLQQKDEDKPNDWVPIGYWSKTLTNTERNYSTTERECYSVVWSVTTLRPYIEGLTFMLDEDLDIFDMALAYRDEGLDLSIADVPVRLMKDELLEAQSSDEFCQTVFSRESRNLDTHFFEGNDGLLRRQHPTDPEIVEILLPDTHTSRPPRTDPHASTYP